MTKSVLKDAINEALQKIDKLWEDVGGEFTTHASINGMYKPEDNFQAGWNTGFWTGIFVACI